MAVRFGAVSSVRIWISILRSFVASSWAGEPMLVALRILMAKSDSDLDNAAYLLARNEAEDWNTLS